MQACPQQQPAADQRSGLKPTTPRNRFPRKLCSSPPVGVVREMKSKIFAVFETIVRHALDPQVRCKIDCGDALIDHFRFLESELLACLSG